MGLIGIKAQVLSPFYYHGRYIPDGSASDARILTDTGVVFALASIFRSKPEVFPRKKPQYLDDLQQIPWRASLFLANSANLLPPVRHTINVQHEGGYSRELQESLAKGNFKTTFFVNEIAQGSQYTGALWGPDPFALAQQDSLVVRMGVGRLGLVKLTPTDVPLAIILNTATLALFGHALPESSRILATIRLSHPMPPTEAEHWLAQC